jgi:hypothetical protein
LVLGVVLLLAGRSARALDGQVVVEIDEGVEALLDVRAARRLISLELSELSVRAASSRRPLVLFFRVQPSEHDLRVELWERGEFHGARVVAGANAGGPLGARRVALAAAELARRLDKKRALSAERERAQEARRRAYALAVALGARNGPVALRSSAGFASIGGMDAALFGTRLAAELQVAQKLRLDLGAAWLAGPNRHDTELQWLELSLAPSRRLSLGPKLDLDVGLEVASALLRFGSVTAVDDIRGQATTWSARAGLALRLEPRLSRELRLSGGVTPGLMLRRATYTSDVGPRERLGGFWLGLELGIVLTPP